MAHLRRPMEDFGCFALAAMRVIGRMNISSAMDNFKNSPSQLSGAAAPS